MRNAAIVLLAWYFFFQSQGRATVVGPFVDEKTCNAIRAQFVVISVVDILTPCWRDS